MTCYIAGVSSTHPDVLSNVRQTSDNEPFTTIGSRRAMKQPPTAPLARRTRAEAVKELRTIPGIGVSLAGDLWDLGMRGIDDLSAKNPRRLYEKLNRLTNAVQDPCVLYAFRCAVYFATERRPSPAKLRWWYWKDRPYNE